MSRGPVLRAGVVVTALVVVAVGLLVWRATPFGPTEEPGSVRVLEAAAYGATYDVMLPSGRLQLVVGPATSSLDGPLVDGSSATDDVQAERGDRLIPVSWELDANAGTVPLEQREPFTIEVVTGGERYDLGAEESATEEGGFAPRSVVVAVAGEADDTVVEVTYDGQTQSLDVDAGTIDAGVAEQLYAPVRYDVPDPCGQRPARSSGFAPTFVGCDIGVVTLTPYRPGLGWVEDADHSWAVVDVDLEAPYLERAGPNGGIDYDKPAQGSAQRVLLDGAEPDQGELAETLVDSAAAAGQLVFLVSGAPELLRVDRDLRLSAGYGDDDPTARVRLVQDLRLEAA